MTQLPRNTILIGDALTRLRELPSSSVDMAITSPPYFQLRDYAQAGQLGLEPTVHEWTQNLRQVCHEIGRVLLPTGSLWLNLGDSFSRHPKYGAPAKSLLLAPERLLLALSDDGWLVRTKVIWHKPNAMPSSVTDRLTLTYEVIYHLVRQRTYFFDLDAIREPHRSGPSKQARTPQHHAPNFSGPLAASRGGLHHLRREGLPGHPRGKNPGDCWSIATRGFRGSHFATYPAELVRRPILATCPAVVCTACGAGQKVSTGALPCDCHAPARAGIALDAFFGTGTTGLVARQLGRDWLGIELNPDYAAMAYERLSPRSDHRGVPVV
ncbi:methyltransferase [Rhizocola hellebori]|uniref:Methyltransferase n=1 Tax=Rhizocola hellebori TaxID=1392758 RepID=A0A8J3VHL9_9ACTN|nr:site-specific DNA-methyltransferase [Rhizocola hellebori]GIH06640.1 methyltransferase [Rhizocola hellebori]